jgi:hypothetical protein
MPIEGGKTGFYVARKLAVGMPLEFGKSQGKNLGDNPVANAGEFHCWIPGTEERF